jgi:ABC-2 type transport system permease protein
MTATTVDRERGGDRERGDRERPADRARRSVPRAGWSVIASKEFGDHVLSARFVVLGLIMALAAAVPLYFVGAQVRESAENAKDFPALYIALFWLTPSVNDQISLPSVVEFLVLVGPLLGLAFAFDSINGERADGTLPRLLSQPIHRDDVVNGKFVAGLAVIALVLVVMVIAVTAFALIRLGIVPEAAEVLRIVIWLLVTLTYVATWLAFGMLLSVAIRRAATSALVGFGMWLLLTFFGSLIVSLIGGFVAPITQTSLQDQLRSVGIQETLTRLLPSTLYREASLTLLNPQVTTISTPTTVGQLGQASQRIPSLFSFDQSLLLVWPQIVALVAMMVACFAVAYVLFMRQEVRA